MKFDKIHAASMTICGVIVLAGSLASAEIVIEHPHPGPGPSYVPIKPHYYDAHHTDSDYNYWQAKHNEEVQAKEQRDHDLAVRQAQAANLERQEQLEQRMNPAR
jgi:hypothetical protein